MKSTLDFDSKFLPKLISFSNGNLLPSKESQLQCMAFKNKNTGKTEMAIATEKLAYVGEENSSDLFYTILKIKNKRTNKVRLVAVSPVSLNVQMSKTNELLDNTLNKSNITVRDLNKQFGTKKAKKRTEMHEKLNLNVSHIDHQLKTAVADVEIKEQDLTIQAIDENANSYRPHINRNATTVEEVYDLYSIVSEEVLDSLDDLAKSVMEHTLDDKSFSHFVAKCIRECKSKNIKDPKPFKILLYIDAIIKFFQISTRFLSKKVIPLDPYPKVVVNKILNDFTVFGTSSRSRPLSMRDKETCYIIVLGFIAMNYQLDLTMIGPSLTASSTKLLNIAQSLGAQSLSSKEKLKVVLKLPLPPPRVDRMSKKRRR